MVKAHPEVGLKEGTNAVFTAQSDQTLRMVPALLVFHAFAATAVHVISGDAIHPVLKTLWPWCCLIAAGAFSILYLAWRRGALSRHPAQTQSLIDLMGLVMGLVWAMPAAAYALEDQAKPLLPLIAVSLAVMGVSAMALLRAPIALVVFISLMTAALSRSAWHAMDEYGAMAGASIVLYGVVLLALTLTSHRHFVRHTLATAQLRNQHAFTSLLLDHLETESHDWLWETDADGRITYASPRLGQQLGLNQETVMDSAMRALFAGRTDAKSWHALEAAIAAQRDFEAIHLIGRNADEGRAWVVMGRALLDEHGLFQGFRGVGRDLARQQAAERIAASAVQTAEAANAAKSRFLAVMSHELRTPIHTIIGFAELLLKKREATLTEKAQQEFTVSILDQARMLQGLINDMLDATRFERGTVKLVEQEFDVAEVVELAVNGCKAQAESAQVSLVVSLVDGVELWGDSARLKQALGNILNNAIKFSPDGGVVYLDMLKGQDGGALIEVRDAGIGIGQQDIDRLFQPFTQADDSLTRRFNGLGLGLAIARGILRLHDGDLTLSSTEGAGTTARLLLPQARVTWHMSKATAVKESA